MVGFINNEPQFILSIVWHYFVPPSVTVKAPYYLEVIKRLKKSMAHKRNDIKDIWKIHQDNAPNHTSFVVSAYLARLNVTVVPHPTTLYLSWILGNWTNSLNNSVPLNKGSFLVNLMYEILLILVKKLQNYLFALCKLQNYWY